MQPQATAEKTTMRLESLNVPDKIQFYYLDSATIDAVNKAQRIALDSLERLHGGPLGIISLKNIVFGCKNISSYNKELSKLPGINKENNNRFSLEEGPAIQLTNSKHDGVEKIVVTVNSLAKARSYLQSKKILGRATKDSVFINPEAIDGLIIELVQQ